MMEAQRFPEDYDGIIAGDPDYNQTHHEIGAHLWISLALFGHKGAVLSLQQAALIGNAVNEACDGLDGVSDGVLEDPVPQYRGRVARTLPSTSNVAWSTPE